MPDNDPGLGVVNEVEILKEQSILLGMMFSFLAYGMRYLRLNRWREPKANIMTIRVPRLDVCLMPPHTVQASKVNFKMHF